jgi:beta-amylase
MQCAKQDPDIYYKSKPTANGSNCLNDECVSLFADHVPCLAGRTPIKCYQDMMTAFSNAMSDMLGTVILEVVVGMGPCGELRYPSYPDIQGWKFPGVRVAVVWCDGV